MNRIDTDAHAFIQADCLEWIQEAAQRKAPQSYGLIFLDPPTFSNSKRMAGTFDVQRDHEALIKDALKLLSADGVLLFSTNSKHFKLRVSLTGIDIQDITRDTIPLDFARRPHIHCPIPRTAPLSTATSIAVPSGSATSASCAKSVAAAWASCMRQRRSRSPGESL